MTDILYHAGIKGQRKGVRRFQFLNGTYTEAGNERYRPRKGTRKRSTGETVAKIGIAGNAAIIAANSISRESVVNGANVVKDILTHLSSAGSSHAIQTAKWAISTIPTAFWALALPPAVIGLTVLAIEAPRITEDIKNKLEDLNISEILQSDLFTVGSAAAGVALSTITGNPLPAITSIGLSAYKLMKHDIYGKVLELYHYIE